MTVASPRRLVPGRVWLVGLAALVGPLRSQAQVPSRLPPRLVNPGGCPGATTSWWQHLANGGRIVCAADPRRPAILLVHGLHQDLTTWTAPSHVGYAYQVSGSVATERLGDTHSTPNSGIYKVGESPWLYGTDPAAWDRAVNWFDYLAGLGFTVATWSQPGRRFADALPSALLAFDSLITQTAARSPAGPPPIALIGHSRGGLLIRQVLKARGSRGRVRWVITLHSPHHGSALGGTPQRVVDEAVNAVAGSSAPALTDPLKAALEAIVRRILQGFPGRIWPIENAELDPNSSLIRGLAQGEQPLPGVAYYTFGGDNPTFFRLYLWTFDAMSAVPQYRGAEQYFVWHAVPAEIGPLSPMLDRMRPFVDEVRPGRGDGLVTDASARLPWSIHVTDHLNHAEVLWNRPLQARVAQILGGPTHLAQPGVRP